MRTKFLGQAQQKGYGIHFFHAALQSFIENEIYIAYIM